MKQLLKSAFTLHFGIAFMAFMVFSTNTFTVSTPIINILASILIIGIYLVVFYSDTFKATICAIHAEKKPVMPIFSSVILYIIPCLLLLWGYLAPLEYGILVSEPPTTEQIEQMQAETGEEIEYEPVYESAVRQTAWFELYMQPYKGVYRLTGNSIITYIISFLLGPIAAMLGYIHAKSGKDYMKKLEKKFLKMKYQD